MRSPILSSFAWMISRSLWFSLSRSVTRWFAFSSRSDISLLHSRNRSISLTASAVSASSLGLIVLLFLLRRQWHYQSIGPDAIGPLSPYRDGFPTIDFDLDSPVVII